MPEEFESLSIRLGVDASGLKNVGREVAAVSDRLADVASRADRARAAVEAIDFEALVARSKVPIERLKRFEKATRSGDLEERVINAVRLAAALGGLGFNIGKVVGPGAIAGAALGGIAGAVIGFSVPPELLDFIDPETARGLELLSKRLEEQLEAREDLLRNLEAVGKLEGRESLVRELENVLAIVESEIVRLGREFSKALLKVEERVINEILDDPGFKVDLFPDSATDPRIDPRSPPLDGMRQREDPRIDPRSSRLDGVRRLNDLVDRTEEGLRGARRELVLFREDLQGAGGDAALLGGTLGDVLSDIDDTTAGLRDEFGSLFDRLGRDIGATGGLATAVLGDLSAATRGLAGVVDGVLNESLARTVRRWQEVGESGVQALEAILRKIFEVQAAAAAAGPPDGGGGLGGILNGVFGAIGGAFGLFGGGGGPVAAVSPGSGSIFGGAGGFKFSSLPGLQGGGPVVPDRPVMVGERGPELLVPTAPGRVIDNLESERMLGPGAAPVSQINIYQNFELRGRLTQHEAFIMEGQMRRIGRESNMELVREVQRGGGMAQIFGRRPMR